MKKTKKILASLMAAATLVVGISGMSASAYTSKSSWNILVTPDAPQNPGQHVRIVVLYIHTAVAIRLIVPALAAQITVLSMYLQAD